MIHFQSFIYFTAFYWYDLTYLSVSNKKLLNSHHLVDVPENQRNKHFGVIRATLDHLIEMATHTNILAWKIPWTEELGGL